MAFDSLTNLKTFLLMVIVLTVFILINLIWSLGNVYSFVHLGFIYERDVNQVSIETRSFAVIMANSSRDTNVTKPTARPDYCKDCFAHDFHYIIQNNEVCKTTNGTSVDLVVCVFTVHGNVKQREAIRKTWLSVSKNNTSSVRYVFLLGETKDKKQADDVVKENNIYHDIVKESFADSYQNLTYKTIMGFKWTTLYCSNAEFVMKTDDDMYVNIPALLKVLSKEATSLQTSVSGHCVQKAEPIRNVKSKWYASFRSYPRNYYPGFCSGTGYVTSRAVAEKIYAVSKTIPFFHLEDVYVALCVKKLGFKLKHVTGFHSYRTKLDPCLMKSDKVVTSHEIPTDFLYKVHNAVCK